MESVGQILRDARERKELTTSQVAAATRIGKQTIEEIERDDFDRIPAKVYARGFLRIYAEVVGVDPDEILELFQQQINEVAPPAPQDVTPELALEPGTESAPGESSQGGKVFASALAEFMTSDRLRQVGAILCTVVVVILVASGLKQCVHRVARDLSGEDRGLDEPLKFIDEPPEPYIE